MALYFIHFSCHLDLVTPKQAEAAVTVYRNLKSADALRSKPIAHGFDVSLADEPAGSVLWLRDEDCGNPDALVAFVLRLAREFQLVGTWGFQFARWCSHREVESFGGGAFLLDLGTGTVLEHVCTQDWLDKRLRPIEGS